MRDYNCVGETGRSSLFVSLRGLTFEGAGQHLESLYGHNIDEGADMAREACHIMEPRKMKETSRIREANPRVCWDEASKKAKPTYRDGVVSGTIRSSQ